MSAAVKNDKKDIETWAKRNGVAAPKLQPFILAAGKIAKNGVIPEGDLVKMKKSMGA